MPPKNWLPNFKTNSHCTTTISCDCMCVYVCAYVHTHIKYMYVQYMYVQIERSLEIYCPLQNQVPHRNFLFHEFFCLQVARPDEVDQIFLISPNKEPTPPSPLHTTDILWKIPCVLVAWTQLTLLLLQLIISLTCHACKLTMTCQVISNDDMPSNE